MKLFGVSTVDEKVDDSKRIPSQTIRLYNKFQERVFEQLPDKIRRPVLAIVGKFTLTHGDRR